jgi:hypothetical protein
VNHRFRIPAMNFKQIKFLVLLSVISLGCDHSDRNYVPYRDLVEDQSSLPAFYMWENSNPGKADSFQPLLVDEKGNLGMASGFKEKPSKSFNQVGTRLFYPPKASAVSDLKESPESVSPDGKWAVKTSSVKTFADDLDNDHLIVRETATGATKEVMVPALSNGEMWPLFWHPQKALIYFMVSIGDDKGRSLQLWEYDLAGGRFRNIGDTDGDAFISPDGSWIIWETGPTSDMCHLKQGLHCVFLCGYDTIRKANYQITTGPSISFFQRWKAP